MRTETINIYSFTELSEEVQKKVLSKYYDINVSHDWWEDTYEDAENIGLKLQYFGLDRNKHATGTNTLSLNEVFQNILSNYGENCDTYKTAERFFEAWQPVFNDYIATDEGENELLEIEDKFLKELLSDYADILQKECEYLQTDEAIKETILENEYEFTENGKRY